MSLFTTKRVCHYCETVRKVSKKTGTFKPHEVMVDVRTYNVPSAHVEPSLRDRDPTTEMQSGIWKLCYGSERKPWPLEA
jgi:hypothetical protein